MQKFAHVLKYQRKSQRLHFRLTLYSYHNDRVFSVCPLRIKYLCLLLLGSTFEVVNNSE